MPTGHASKDASVLVTPENIAHPTEKHAEQKLTVLENHGYFIGRSIGKGSYSTVKVAESARHNGKVAIKIVSKFTAPTDYLKKFLPREIETVKGLKHPNLIRFLQAIETTHRVYIIMEYADNGSLLEVIRKESHIKESRAHYWFRQLVDVIEYCHSRGVVHRDIKCENMLMDNSFNIKLSDFGFARKNLKTKTGAPFLSQTYCGSYAYASPEILRGIPYDPKQSDIWSLGVVLYAMVFGRLPFDDANYNALLKQVSKPLYFPKEPKVSSSCKALIAKIVAPLKIRANPSEIRQDPWFKSEELSAVYVSENKLPVAEISAATIEDTATAVQLVTKELLKSKTHKVDDANASIDERSILTEGSAPEDSVESTP